MDDKLNNLNKNVTSNKNELSEPFEKVKAISTKGLTKNLINKFSILFINIFLQEYFKIIYYLYQLKNTIYKYFSATIQIGLWKFNGISEENIENITKSDSNLVTTFADNHVLPDINFNGNYFIKNINVPEK